MACDLARQLLWTGTMKKKPKTLELSRETVRRLDPTVLTRVDGGAAPRTQSCYSCKSFIC